MTILSRLQHWYQVHCNGDWEHQNGIKIETLDNPGWLIKVDLTGTNLENSIFEPIAEGVDDDGFPQKEKWLHCQVSERVWQGAGDGTALEEILEIFLDWTDQNGLK